MISIYKVLTYILFPFLILYTFFRKVKKKEDALRYKEKIFPGSFNIIKKKNSKLIWFHAASVGELNSILPIINELNLKKNNIEFLITTVTLSSGNLIKDKLSNFKNVHHRYFPIDVDFLMRRFVRMWQPDVVFFVDSEIWPNLILVLYENKTPFSIINARITEKTYRRWLIFKNTAKKIFGKFNLFLASNKETVNYLKELGANNIIFNGNIKLLSEVNVNNINNVNENILKKVKFWLSASTHNGEEEFCLKTHIFLKKRFKKIITLIAPRHINRVEQINKLCKNFDLNPQILNKNEKINDNSDVIIINSFGVLNEFYKYAVSVFIGKSTLETLKKVGGQNPIDAAKLGCKIYHGPYIYNFKEIYEILSKYKISKEINSPEELSNYLEKDLIYQKSKLSDLKSPIDDLSKETLKITMNNINKFLFNEAI